MNKYHNKKVNIGGITFDSKKEASRWNILLKYLSEGKIRDLKRQVPFELIPKQELPHPYLKKGRNRRTIPAVKYVADFTYYTADGEYIVEDTKGFRTADYKLKYKLMLYVHGIQIKEI